MHSCNPGSGSGHMVRLAGPAGMSCPVCMAAACTRVKHTMCFAGCVYTEMTLTDMLIDVAIGEVGHCDE